MASKPFLDTSKLDSTSFYETFRKYDKDGNNYIEAKEIDAFMKDLFKMKYGSYYGAYNGAAAAADDDDDDDGDNDDDDDDSDDDDNDDNNDGDDDDDNDDGDDGDNDDDDNDDDDGDNDDDDDSDDDDNDDNNDDDDDDDNDDDDDGDNDDDDNDDDNDDDDDDVEENFLLTMKHPVGKARRGSKEVMSSVDFMKIWTNYDPHREGYLGRKQLRGFIADYLEFYEEPKKPADEAEKQVDYLLKNFDKDHDGEITMTELQG
ncbi:hypothetical protein AC249_AIPGENE15017 [Exaiptasia diaphana]|nr:hypothetical protein AC249_AIPGENE15017 [Exaiptasia diaphana]